MPVTDNRPIFLNLLKIRLPVTGYVSILHRISGFFLFLAIPFSVYIFDLSLQGKEGFELATEILQRPIVQLLSLVLLWSLIHHLFAGLRYLLMDFDLGLEKVQSIKIAWTVIIAEAIVFALFVVEFFL